MADKVEVIQPPKAKPLLAKVPGLDSVSVSPKR